MVDMETALLISILTFVFCWGVTIICWSVIRWLFRRKTRIALSRNDAQIISNCIEFYVAGIHHHAPPDVVSRYGDTILGLKKLRMRVQNLHKNVV